MKHEEDYYEGINGLKIYYQVWRPDETPKAVVQIVHGLAEHSGRYLNVVNELVPKGYIIYASDLRGHGKTKSLKAYTKKFDYFVEDQKILFDLIRERAPDLPIFMLGHSMGSLIARVYAATYPEGLTGLILSGTGKKEGAGANAFLKAMVRMFSVLSPKRMVDPKLDPETLSHDPEVVKAYKEDPLVFTKITIRLGAELLKGFKKANKMTKNIKVPTLIQSGSADKLVIEAEEVGKLLKISDKTIKIYDGLYHEVYNELEEDRKIVLKDLVDWLDSHL
ncbi:MAG: lysophospholipase [Candidatus Helarchaeota archaeon]|nr:lysophospholipase [Candidatus Helarchaeota archaeon]